MKTVLKKNLIQQGLGLFTLALVFSSTIFAQQAALLPAQAQIPLAGIVSEAHEFAKKIQSFKSSIPLEEKINQTVLHLLENSINTIIGVQLTGLEKIDRQTATQLETALPKAYDALVSSTAYQNNPSVTSGILVTAAALIKDKLPEQTSSFIADLTNLTQIIAQSNNPIDQEALKSFKVVFDTFLCISYNKTGCAKLGIVPQMLQIVLDKNIPKGSTATDVLMTYDITGAIRSLNSNIRRAMPPITKLIAKYIKPNNPAGVTLQTLLEKALKLTPEQIEQVRMAEDMLAKKLG
jgi:hypothetical protein